ncbi:MAG TPA: GWxTD domain-containing protein [Thermoanaerobaculia bacterium]
MKKAILLGILAASSAFGQQSLSPKYNEWYASPVKFLMTADENRQFHALTSDTAAESFIALFWAKRDPTPSTERNEFQEEFDRRVAAADKHFSDGSQRGALSDRGKTLILLGPPYRVSGSAGREVNGGGIATNVGRRGSAAGVARGPTADPETQYWMYAHQNKPKFITQGDFTIAFARQPQGDWQLATTERTKPEQIFIEAVNGYIVSPNLTAVPNYAKPAIYNPAFKSADIKAAFENFKSDTAPLTWGEFVTAEGEHFVSAHLSLPATAAGKNVTSWAVVEDSNGKIADVKENATAVATSGAETYIDRSLQLDPGSYTVTYGASWQGDVIAASRAKITVQGLDPKAPAVSPLILASAVVPLKTNWEPMDPFTFGGFKVIPKADATFGMTGDLWYFVELRNPGVTDVGKPNIRVQVDVRGTTAKGPVEMHLPIQDASLAALKDETNRYALGTALPLESFRPGDYTMKVHVVDVVLGKEYDLEKAFHIRG